MFQLHIAVFLFGLSGLFGKLLDIPSTSIVFGRTLVATLTLIILTTALKAKLPPRHLLWKSIPSGFLLALHWVTFFYSIQISSVAVGLLSYSTFPVFVTFLDPIFTRTKIRSKDILIALIVFGGLILIVPSVDFGNKVFAGVFWGLISGLSFALLTIWNRQLVQNASALQLGLLQNLWATIALLPIVESLTTINSTQLGFIVFLGVFCTALAHWCFISALRSIRSQTASITSTLEPVYGILLAILILNEIPTPRECLGGLIILITVGYATWIEKPH